MTTYQALQAEAKSLGIKANQKAEVLTALIAQHKASQAPSNPFEAFKSDVQAIADKLTAQGVDAEVVAPRPELTKQQKYLLDLRKRFNMSENILGMSFKEMAEEISALRSRPAPASASQIEKIHSIIAEMREHGATINISAEKIASLTGGREGTASKCIEFLMQQRGKLNIVAPASEAQVNTIAEWFLCPDIPFENYNINKKVLMPDVSATAWRFMTPTEFKEEVMSKMKRSEASQFIDAHRATYYEWRKTRATQGQINHIRELDKRLANMESQAEVTFAMDLEGNIVEVATAKKNDYNPCAHEPLSDMQLQQMSVQEATRYIDQMKSEQSRRYSSIDSSKSQQDLEDKVHSFSERTGTGSAKTTNDARSREYHKLSDLIYKLEAVTGQQNEELHDVIKEVLIDGGGSTEHAKQEIKAFMHLCVNRQDADRALRTAGALLQIAEETTIGTAIAQEVVNEVADEYSEAV